MTVYTYNDFVGGLEARSYCMPTAASVSPSFFALDCEGANGYAYVTATAPPGFNDVMQTSSGTSVITGTWALTTSRANLGTSSMVVGTGSTDWFRSNSAHSSNGLGHAMSTWIYVDALPASDLDLLYQVASTSRPATPSSNGYSLCLSLLTNGRIKYTCRINSAEVAVTSTAAITAGAWHFVSITKYSGTAWIKVNSTVEQFAALPGSPPTSYYGGVKGGSAYTGVYLDDIRIDRFYDRRQTLAAVPTIELGSLPAAGSKASFNYGTLILDQLYDVNSMTPAADIPAAEYFESYNANISTARPAFSPGLAYLLGADFTGTTYNRGSTGGGGGPIRPSSGFLYPRGDY